MKKIILSLLYIIFLPALCFGLDIYHPQSQDITLCESGIFFAGKIENGEEVFINNTKINPEKNGAFCHSFNLNNGVNIFEVMCSKDGVEDKIINYTIRRTTPTKNINNKFTPLEKSYYETNANNIILRSSPIDGGMNRLGYLPCGVKVVVDGVQNQFSRIYLSQNRYGWIKTNDLTKVSDDFCYSSRCILNSCEQKVDDGILYHFYLSDSTPYSAVSNGQDLRLNIYNIDTESEIYNKVFKLDKFPRYSVEMQDNVLKIYFKETPIKPDYKNKKIKIVIDAGHGGSEEGAVGCLGDKEKDLNLEVAQKLKELLEQHKFKVSMTRECDKFLSLSDRVNYAKDKDAIFFISIHHNSVPYSVNPYTKSGCAVYYYNPQCKQFAQEVSKEVSKGLSVKDNGAIQASYAVIRPSEYIGILVELAYLVNPKDVDIYKAENYSQISAEAIYSGLVNYINSELMDKE